MPEMILIAILYAVMMIVQLSHRCLGTNENTQHILDEQDCDAMDMLPNTTIYVLVRVLPFVIAHWSWLNANVALETR